MARTGAQSVLTVHAAWEWSPRDDVGCIGTGHLQGDATELQANWAWIRRTDSCGATWDNQIVRGVDQQPLKWWSGLDGPAAYVDPFDTDGSNVTVYVTADVTRDSDHAETKAVMRSDESGAPGTWSTFDFGPAPWRLRLTSTGPHTVSLSPTGTHSALFAVTCNPGEHPKVHFSYDRGVTWGYHALGDTDGPVCAQVIGTKVLTTDIARFRTWSEAFDTVRISYLADLTPDKAFQTIGVVEQMVTVPVPATGLPVGVGAPLTFAPLLPVGSGGVVAAGFIEPDAFEWTSNEPLPDTTVLSWFSAPSFLDIFPTHTAGYSVFHHDINGLEVHTPAASLAIDATGGTKAWTGISNTDFDDGAFWYSIGSSVPTLNYLATWPEGDELHYNVVSMQPPPSLWVHALSMSAAGTNGSGKSTGVSLSTVVKKRGDLAWDDVHVGWAYQDEHARWRKLEDGCVHPTVEVAPDGLSATYHCDAHPLSATRILAFARPNAFVPPPHADSNGCPPEFRLLCDDETASTGSVSCEVPRVGSPVTCVRAPIGRSSECAGRDMACGSATRCCTSLACLDGICRPQ